MDTAQLLAQLHVDLMLGLGFGFGSIFWAIVLWIIFGKR